MSVPSAAVTTTASMDVATLSRNSNTAAVLIQQQQHHHLLQQQQQHQEELQQHVILQNPQQHLPVQVGIFSRKTHLYLSIMLLFYLTHCFVEQVVRPQQPLLIPVHSVVGAQERRRSKRSQVTTNSLSFPYRYLEECLNS